MIKLRYCVLYPEAKNIHLIKDVGMIAYKLNKLYNFDSSISCYENDEYSFLNNEVKGLKVEFIQKKYNNSILDGMRYLRKKSKNIDILQVFHVTLRTVAYTFTYKFFNPKGEIFLKLDCTDRLISIIKSLSPLKLKILNVFLNKVDIIGVEQEKLYNELKEIINMQQDKLTLIPNGIDFESSAQYKNMDFKEKKNFILNVSRIGSPEKGIDVLLEAFSKINNIENMNWKLVLVGPIEEGFNAYIQSYFNKNPKLKQFIEFKGPIYDRKLLFELYKKAKVFCLSSSFESFGIALLEAASFGDVIVSTDVGIAGEIVGLNNGAVVPVGDVEALSENLKRFMLLDNLEEISKTTKNICRDRYDWNQIVCTLYNKLIQ